MHFLFNYFGNIVRSVAPLKKMEHLQRPLPYSWMRNRVERVFNTITAIVYLKRKKYRLRTRSLKDNLSKRYLGSKNIKTLNFVVSTLTSVWWTSKIKKEWSFRRIIIVSLKVED